VIVQITTLFFKENIKGIDHSYPFTMHFRPVNFDYSDVDFETIGRYFVLTPEFQKKR